jgi:hypothetical protein
MTNARAVVALAAVVAGAVVAGAVVQVAAAVGSGVLVDHRLRAAREDDAARVVAAMARDDCPAAAAAYRAATTGPALPRRRPPIPEDVTRAAKDCRDLTRLDALADSGRRPEALGGYLEFRRVHRFSPLHDRIPDRIGDVLRPGPLTPDRETCVLLAQMAAPGDVPASADTTPGLLTTRGELLAASRDKNDRERDWAAILLLTVRQKYRGTPEAARAEVAEAALLVRDRSGDISLERPGRVPGASAGPGRARVVYENHTRGTMTFAISGPGGGRVVEVAPCGACPALDESADCTRKVPTAVVTLPAGTYRVWISIDYSSRHYTWSDTWRLTPGSYEDCLADRKS